MDGGVTRYEYSQEGYLVRPIDQTGITYLVNEYDERLMIREVCYPDGSRQIYGYDDGRNRILSQDRLGRVPRREYDSTGHLVKEEDPAGLVTEYSYDATGDLTGVRDNGGRERLLSYDAL